MKYRSLKPEQIQVADSYQRSLSESFAAQIARGYDEEAFGVLVVGEREDGSYWCVDGQTRKRAAVLKGLKTVRCLVFQSCGKQHEAKMFRLLNMQRNMSKIDKVRALIDEGDKDTVAMNDEVQACGFELALKNEQRWPFIRSMVPVEKAYQLGILSRVLRLVDASWGVTEDQQALQVPILGGVTKFLRRWGEIVDDEMFVEVLQKFTCAQLVAQCDAQKMQGGGRESAMLEVLRHQWNRIHGKKKRFRLEEEIA